MVGDIIITQLAVYTTIYHLHWQLGDYLLPTTYSRNQETPLNIPPKKHHSVMKSRLVFVVLGNPRIGKGSHHRSLCGISKQKGWSWCQCESVPQKMGCETWSAICINFNNIRQNNTLEVSEKKCLNNTWLHYLKGLGALFISTIHWHKHQVLHLFGTWNS